MSESITLLSRLSADDQRRARQLVYCSAAECISYIPTAIKYADDPLAVVTAAHHIEKSRGASGRKTVWTALAKAKQELS